jgi:putative zinc finger protein
MTQHPDEGTLHAYIDGELPGAEAKALEAHVAGCASCSAALAEARGLVAVTSQVISALDAVPAAARTPAAVVGRASTERAARVSRPPVFRMPYARAAALLLLVGGSAFVADRSGMFDRSARPRAVSMEADAAQSSAPAIEPAAEAAASAPAASAPASSASTDLSTASVGSASGAVARKEATPRVVANRAMRDGALAKDNERAMAAPETLSSIRQQDAATAVSLKRAESAEATRAPALAAAPPAPPMAPPPPARSVDFRLSEVVVTSASDPVRVSRYRTKAGTILTLTEEPLRTSFGEESDARRTAAAGAQRPAAAAMSAPVVNSYRWSSPEQGRSYTLTGPLPVAELESLSKRLSELERLP